MTNRTALCAGCYVYFICLFFSCGNQPAPQMPAHKNPGRDTGSVKGLKEKSRLGRASAANEFQRFIPQGYNLLDSSSGNLNSDPFPDIILVLKKTDENKTSDAVSQPEKRPLLLLTGGGNGNYTLSGRNDNAVFCVDCGGTMGDPFVDVVIKDGYFSIEHHGGRAIQIDKPNRQLQEITGVPVKYFAYPFGLWDTHSVAEIKKRGFTAAFQLSIKRDDNEPMHTIRRIIVPGQWSNSTFDRAIKNSFMGIRKPEPHSVVKL